MKKGELPGHRQSRATPPLWSAAAAPKAPAPPEQSYAKETPLEMPARQGWILGGRLLVNWLREEGARGDAK
ncbi:exported hypothetical protein [Verrucomicrobia bacterium]|nr:exported hypothetical protein [Verrucomicrobiota bacterium]